MSTKQEAIAKLQEQQAKKKAMQEFVAKGGESPPVLKEEKKEEEKKEKEEEEGGLPSAEEIKNNLRSVPGAPSAEQIESWKAQYDNVYVSFFGPQEVIVWRCLFRDEYRNLRALAAQNQAEFTQLDYEELMVATCKLWPPADSAQEQRAFRKAGVFSTVFEQIQQASHFAPAHMVGLFVAEL